MVNSELLWVLQELPAEYVVVDTETTGLFDGEIAPDLISIGLTLVVDHEPFENHEFRSKPTQAYSHKSDTVHGIPWEDSQGFKPLAESWAEVSDLVANRLLIAHNALFDWRVLCVAAERNHLDSLSPSGVLCSQRALQPWAMANHIKVSDRGPSLDALADFLDVRSTRTQYSEHHSASTDSEITAIIIELLRKLSG
jgi:DNA polymerase III epsilon subunit-like protein